ncbi:T-complex protein 1 subunit beta [Nematocida displodere]|uniref:T-complex protein 1 subunit beta n=1 Tax=Nematocida displodere TaxID=1805483 RepID=A0A177EJC2_9MICR|nr:T-complex protein 1 subunit beta [Nematocida displodere]
MSQLLRPGATQEKSEEARTSFLVGAISVSNTVKSTLGPRGMLKLLYTSKGEPIITNDGATVLKNIVPNGPSAKILINSAQEHGENEGDGTTTLTVLTGELLQEADRLIFKGTHPYRVISAYRKAHLQAIARLRQLSHTAERYEDKLNLAKTTLSSKFSPMELQSLAELAVKVSETVVEIDMISVVKLAGGEVSDSYVDEGLLLECEIGPGQNTAMDNPRVLIVNTAMDTDKVKIFGAKASVTSPKELGRLEEAEKQKMSEKVASIAAHADVIVNRQIIYDYPTQEFTRLGKMSIERADFTGVEMLARVLSGRILSTFGSVQPSDVGHCRRVERVKLSNRTFTRFSGVPSTGACTIVIRGPSKEILEEAERSLIGAIKVLKGNTQEYVYGGGSAEAAVSCAITPESEGERAFSRALLEVARILAENAGHNPDDTIDTILRKNKEGVFTWGVGAEGAQCMEGVLVKESLRLKEIIWTRAAEVTEMLLRCDGIIRCKPRERVQE